MTHEASEKFFLLKYELHILIIILYELYKSLMYQI